MKSGQLVSLHRTPPEPKACPKCTTTTEPSIEHPGIGEPKHHLKVCIPKSDEKLLGGEVVEEAEFGGDSDAPKTPPSIGTCPGELHSGFSPLSSPVQMLVLPSLPIPSQALV
uniref:Uncharacterized protein n=1 Tax=Nelumbo nucifera TaxID=4432 RepID=A0A822XGB5_NELNU|nr:TPA_asm: hypothetical protein HUJ06_019520 [Nelumbo nucifera]